MLYLLELTPDDNDTLLVTCPKFPEVTTFAKDRNEAWINGTAAIEEAIAARIRDGDPIPRSASEAEMKRQEGIWVKMPLLTSLKALLYTLMRDEGMTRAELGRRLGWKREQVDRLFRIGHASRADQLEAAFEKLGRDVDVRLRVHANGLTQ
jgi:antitoxin HicB